MVQKIDNRVTNYIFTSREVTDALVDLLKTTGVDVPFGAKIALGLSPENDGMILSIITNPDGSPADDMPPIGFH